MTISIWIVDDSQADHALYRLAFKDLIPDGVFRSFYSAEDAVEAVVGGEMPSLVLLDLNMPGLGGMYFLSERRRRALLGFPVVILSSSSNPEDIQQTYALGANSYLEKPEDFKALKEFAKSVTDYWFRWSHLPTPTS